VYLPSITSKKEKKKEETNKNERLLECQNPEPAQFMSTPATTTTMMP
jgi:hypothetical protein